MGRVKGVLFSHCKRGHPLTDDNVYVGVKDATGRIKRQCRKCSLDRSKTRSKEQLNAYYHRTAEKFREKHRARSKLGYAVVHGKIIKPTTCEECGITAPRIDAHHQDYSKPLEVNWLCVSCHRSYHGLGLRPKILKGNQ